jgi:PKHD-type hydroxylase
MQPLLPLNDGIVLPTGFLRTFTEPECARIIEIGESIKPQEAVTSDGGKNISYQHRRSLVRQLFPGDPAHRWIFDRMEALVAATQRHFGFELSGFYEGAQYYEYPTGGFLDAHMDIGRGHMSTRKLGVSVQLSEGTSYEGGDIEFLSSNQKGPRELGSFVVFPAFLMHRVTPVTRGTRKCLVTWVHGAPFR